MHPKKFSELGKYLQHKRESSNLTQAQMARKLGYATAQFVSNIERGCAFPPVNMLKGMIKAYRLDEEELMNLLLSIQNRHWRKKLFNKAA